jgi:hypothetical protein
MLAEESSLGMMSDSFEKPGSEYGDMRSLDMTESDVSSPVLDLSTLTTCCKVLLLAALLGILTFF